MNALDRITPDPAIDKFVDTSFNLSDRIHEILESKGLTQKDLAEMLGKKESQVSKWMTGTHNFTIRTLALLEVTLGASIFQVTGAPFYSEDEEVEEQINAIV
ncbi:MAG: transcriptional regulator [Dyadobacter sp. 50-39]|uniref:helix-turn-helix domain-containing protein n=1 Tax=Dyadobacter sp. 50-39 TaxID=1895756 RepID=UPI00095E4A23|nr:helix-turn-helix transcriptional regulator [Dyadobacter sp. 50-39]OJV14828.1 MAG: transcriptional regulator [Dyadobacter sp. 50-39]